MSRKLEISFLGNYSSNKYQFIPRTRDTEFGTKDLPLNLRIYYEGQEVDQFDTYLGALSLNYRPVKGLSLSSQVQPSEPQNRKPLISWDNT